MKGKRAMFPSGTRSNCLRWALPGVLLGAAMVSALGGCAVAGEQRAIEPEVIVVQLPEHFGALQRPAVEFDHGKHTRALEQEGCKACHLVDEQGALISKLNRERDPEDRDAFVDLYHDKCMGCHKERSAQEKKSLPVTCGECHAKRPPAVSRRLPMVFDYSLHYRHSKASGDKCETCHHIYNKESERLEYKKGTESACRDCHGAKDEGKNLSLRNASHHDCITCHLELSQKGEKGGPWLCKGCHSQEGQRAVKTLSDIPRLQRKQPDAAWIHTSGAKSNLVPFNHKAHEPLTQSCSTCHHKTLKACKECHTLTGSPEANGVPLAVSYHLASSNHSCVGCHKTVTDTKDCSGCHETMQHPPRERACTVCHRGPKAPGATAGAVAPAVHAEAAPPVDATASADAGVDAAAPGEADAEAGAAADPGVVPGAPPTADSQLAALLATLVEAKVELDPLPAPSDDFPDKVVIDVLADKYRPAEVDHRKIVASLDRVVRKSGLARRFHSKTEVLCAGCHHNSPVGARPPQCRACHGSVADAKTDKPALKAAYHRQCIGCHQKMGIVKALGCKDCHAEAPGEVQK